MRKVYFLLLFCCAMANSLLAQIPERINYQCVVRDAAGQPIISGALTIRFSILLNIGGNALYVEDHVTTSNAQGIVTAIIGGGVPVLGNFGNIDWAAGTKFLKLEADLGNTGTFIDMGTTQLVSVPYALVAKRAIEGSTFQSLTGTFFSITQRDTDVYTTDSMVVQEAGNYLMTVDAEGYGLVYNFVNIPYGDNSCYMKVFSGSSLLLTVPLTDNKKDEGYPVGAYNVTGRQTTKVKTVYLPAGSVIRTALRITSYGTAGTNTIPIGCLGYELNLVKLR